jgi:hypothetical protein
LKSAPVFEHERPRNWKLISQRLKYGETDREVSEEGALIPTKVEGIWKLEPKVEYTQEEFDALPPAPRPPTDDEFKSPMTFAEEE